uniref:Uncharacterized protein n=1 Tax=Anopheles melas TaxID=34690 RepID=A0A182TIZ4_9DIPT
MTTLAEDRCRKLEICSTGPGVMAQHSVHGTSRPTVDEELLQQIAEHEVALLVPAAVEELDANLLQILLIGRVAIERRFVQLAQRPKCGIHAVVLLDQRQQEVEKVEQRHRERRLRAGDAGVKLAVGGERARGRRRFLQGELLQHGMPDEQVHLAGESLGAADLDQQEATADAVLG